MADKIEIEMYGGEVKMVFNPDAPRYRYLVTDRALGITDKPMRGVTTLLRDVINKPDLMTWPMNMSHQVLFGTKFDEKSLEYVHDWRKALVKPGVKYSEEHLHEAMMAGAREHNNRSQFGKDFGTVAHRAVEQFLLTGDIIVSDDIDAKDRKAVIEAVKVFADWWKRVNGSVIELERPVYSRKLQYAGTFDLAARINGKNYMLDLKTTNASKKAPLGVYAEYLIQTAAYSYADREENRDTFDDLGIIRIGKDARLNIVTAADMGMTVDGCERAFAFAVRLHDFLEETGRYLSDPHFTSSLNPSEAPVEAQTA